MLRLAQPFLPLDSALLSLFPPRWWAQLLPALVGVLGTAGIVSYIGWILVASQLYRYTTAVCFLLYFLYTC